MTLLATPIDSMTRSVSSTAMLSQLDTGAMINGDEAYVQTSPAALIRQFWYLDKFSTEAVTATVILTKNAGGNPANPGRWILRQIVTAAGTSANPVFAQSHGFFVDPGTIAPLPAQTGAITSPFATI